jgi:hypothetical protein
MSFLNQIGGLISKYAGGLGASSQEEAQNHYDQVAGVVPKDVLGSVIGPALSSLATSEVAEKVLGSANAMNSEQRGGLVQSLINGFASSGTDVSSVLGQLGISQSIADNPETATAEEVSKLAAHAHANDPGVFQSAMSFYAEHPTLVKALGPVAISAISKKLA